MKTKLANMLFFSNWHIKIIQKQQNIEYVKTKLKMT